MKQFTDFAKENGLELVANFIGVSDDDTQFDWIVTLKFVGKGKNQTFRSEYHMGMAHCTLKPLPAFHKDELGRLKWKARTISQLKRFAIVYPTAPDIETVLYSLQSDARIATDYDDMWDFMDNFGYQGREGERIYNACKSSHDKLKKFFGELFSEFSELTED